MTQKYLFKVYTQRNKIIYQNKSLHMYFHSSITYNSQKETIQMPILTWWIDILTEICPYNGIFFCKKKKKRSTDTCYNIDKPWKLSAKWRKPVTKTTYFMILFIWNVWNRQIHEWNGGGHYDPSLPWPSPVFCRKVLSKT